MELEEIYAEISAHMIKGIMIHEQFANYYDFLGLDGYKKCHEYHYLEESCAHRELNRYFINHYNKLIPERPIENPNIIPNNWFSHTRQDVDPSTKMNAIKNGLEKWVEWERDTKKLYEEMYKELIDINEIASAMKIQEFICDVDEELEKAEQYHLNKKAINYDLSEIVAEQKSKHDKYKKEMKKCID